MLLKNIFNRIQKVEKYWKWKKYRIWILNYYIQKQLKFELSIIFFKMHFILIRNRIKTKIIKNILIICIIYIIKQNFNS